MTMKPSPELSLVISAVTVILAMLMVYFLPDGLVKWVIGLAVVLVGVMIEQRIERAYRAKNNAKQAVE